MEKITVYCDDGITLNKIHVLASFYKVQLEQKPFAEAPESPSSPFGISPIMILPCGSPLFGETAVLRAIVRAAPYGVPSLYGRNTCEQALVDQWIEFCAQKIDANVAEILSQIQGSGRYNPRNYDMSVKVIKDAANKIEKIIAPRTFLVGERCTMADIAVAVSLAPMFSTIFGTEERKNLVNISRWINTIMGLHPVVEVCGEFKFAETALAPQKPEKAKKPEKKKPEPEPEPKPEPEPEPEPEEESEEEKPEDPNAPLDMEWWQRLYANTKPVDYPQMWPKLWHKFEIDGSQNFSLYYCDYKYPNEFDKQFKLSNLVSGFLQRLEPLHKIAFASILILGQEGNFNASGVWLWKDTDIPKDMVECPDYPSWTFRKMDPTKPEERKLFQEYCEWEGSFGGKNLPCLDGKLFR